MIGLKAGRLPWVAPTTLAFQPQRSMRIATTTLSRMHQVAYQHRPSRVSLASLRQRTVSLPLRGLLSLPRRILPSTSKASIAPGNYTSTTPRRLERPASGAAKAIALLPLQLHHASMPQPIAIETIVRALASQVSSFVYTFGGRHPPLERLRAARRRLPAAIAPFGYNHPGNSQFDSLARIPHKSPETISTESRPWTMAASHSTTMRRRSSHSQDQHDARNRMGRGDLHLEGSVLGRWLTQHLSREIIRPRAGIIAVDPRITPSWGGPSLST